MTVGRDSWQKILRIACAMVFLSLGLAHHAPVAAEVRIDQTEAYRLPDGTFASLCTGYGDDWSHLKPVRCEVCMLCASLLLPPPDDQAWLVSETVSLVNPPVERPAVAGSLSIPAPRSRAPPVASA
ncbi:hypothetical protein [Rhizobium sp. CSW-27]|uniref:hypothetical protein n=1 Tax=Rhizobium sp. CSW-27 TaxID=2839985 RepID=UPI001C0192BA|nr:hypothetical protein [Rhizobium sp. CSW-27]MBT9370176.1 hypothetical protein [Rhizobium sp. CSW-27]